jgi:hypothetical protein
MNPTFCRLCDTADFRRLVHAGMLITGIKLLWDGLR